MTSQQWNIYIHALLVPRAFRSHSCQHHKDDLFVLTRIITQPMNKNGCPYQTPINMLWAQALEERTNCHGVLPIWRSLSLYHLFGWYCKSNLHECFNSKNLPILFAKLQRVLFYYVKTFSMSLQWRHNGRDGVSNHHPHECLLNRLFERRSKKTSKLRVLTFG